MRKSTTLLMALALGACGIMSGPPGLSQLAPRSAIEGQPLARTVERPPPFAREVASGNVGLGGGLAGLIAGQVVTATVNADERANSRIGQVPTPTGVDPGAIIEAELAAHMVSRFGALPGLTEVFAGNLRATAPRERALEVAELAQRRRLEGLVIDVVATSFTAISTGRNLGLTNEQFGITVTATIGIYDIATGAVLVEGRCAGENGTTRLVADAIESGITLPTVMGRQAAADCAAQFISRMLR